MFGSRVAYIRCEEAGIRELLWRNLWENNARVDE